jgi:hypothetical protein
MGKSIVLVADFFGTLKARGIPAYVRDLQAIAQPWADVRVMRAPAGFSRLPAVLQNVLMVLHEQLAVPFAAMMLRPRLIVFPYNSASFLCSLTQRSVCVIHDLIPYRRANRRLSPAYLYLLATTSWHAFMGRRFAGPSPHTLRVLRHVRRFSGCELHYLPNCFAATAAPSPPCEAGRAERDREAMRVTLISGHSHNKDFTGALWLYDGFLRAQPAALSRLGLDVVGFGEGADQARRIVSALTESGLLLQDVVVHDLLPQPELDRLLRQNEATWAHSKAEGFGRAIVEGRMAGRPVVLSRLAVFRPFRDEWCYAYSNGDATSFHAALSAALQASERTGRYAIVEALQLSARGAMTKLLSDA